MSGESEIPEIEFDEDPQTDVGGLDRSDRVDGRFRVIRQLGKGGMSVVFLAEQEAVGRNVALKILKPPKLQEGEEDTFNFLERFRDEARRLASFQHPNVVTLYDFGETDDGRVFLAMEFVDGPRVSELLRRGPMDTVRVLRILEQTAKALRYTHQRGVIHRDISPANILITADPEGRETVKLIDFGISAEDGNEGDGDMIVGSPSCMSPEQIRGEPLDHRTDVYALGVVAFRMITGRYPYKGRDVTETLRQHLEAPVPSLTKAVAAAGGGRLIPDSLDKLVSWCLSKDREDRPEDMAKVLETIEDIRDELDPDRTRTIRVPDAPEQGTRWWLVLMLAVMAAGLGGLVAWQTRPAAEDQVEATVGVPDALAAPTAEEIAAQRRAEEERKAEEARKEAERIEAERKAEERRKARERARKERSKPKKTAPKKDPPSGYKGMPDF